MIVFLLLEVLSYNIYEALIIFYIVLPYAVAPHQHELIPFLPLKLLYVWFTCYHLLVVGQRASLVVEVPKGS